ncbi:MAG: GTPase HflX [Candidatus Latescibacteria bacterium]|nr:GTPase HflX [Candidatus Latescibacterota bacterium]
MSDPVAPPSPQPVLLVGVSLPHIPVWEAEDSLDELSRLAHTATLREGARLLQHRERIDPTYYIGKGKADELKPLAQGCGADLVVFDNDLSPAQMRNLEKLTGLRILDRSGLILDIFALHARTHTAQLQVELAQLNYLLPRLTRQWSHLSRQAGGGAIRGMGAVGVRGPGETQLEIDRRLIRRRISELNLKLERISGQLATSRKKRREEFKVALVGYTNAGKSTLMRALSGAQVLVADQLFATLDSTTRAVQLGQRRKILLTDTVGFIRRLPHHLFASFHATLEEALQADLLLHVVDMSHPQYEQQKTTVDAVLRELGLEDKPTLLVYNKIDRVDPAEEERLARHYARQAGAVAVSALSGVGLKILREKILFYSQEEEVTVDLHIPQQEGRLLSQLHHQGEVLAQDFAEDQVRLRVRLDRFWVRRWRLERFAPA